MGILLVHAHPDDESIGTGGTMARYSAELAWASGRGAELATASGRGAESARAAGRGGELARASGPGAEGARVTLVTCTLGELGEIIPPSLAHLTPDELGQYRIGELKAACDALGVRDQRFLGGPGRWRDSGMMGTPGNDDPRCFWRADVDEAAGALASVIGEVAPQAIVTYDANGFYGHPDHIQAHRVAWRAYQLACDPARTSFYATAAPDSPTVTVRVDVSRYLPLKFAAMRAHATQITVSEPYFALSNGVWQHVPGVECYTLLAGPGPSPGAGPGPSPGPGPGAGESSLFAQ